MELVGDFSHPGLTCHVSFSGRSLVVSRSLAIRACLAPETVDVGLSSGDFDPFGKLGCLVSTKASTGSRWYHLTQIYEVFNYTLHYYGIPGIPYHYDDICCEELWASVGNFGMSKFIIKHGVTCKTHCVLSFSIVNMIKHETI